MKLNRKLVLFIALALSLALASGGTLAYLSDTDADVNTMTLGNVKIEQLEYERIDTETVGDDAIVQQFHDDKPLYPAVYDEDSVWQPGLTEDDATVTWDQLGNEGSWNGIWDPAELENEVDKFVFAKNTGKSDAYVRTWFAFELGALTMQEWWDMVHLNVNDTHWNWPDSLAGYSEMEIDGVRYAVCCVEYIRNGGVLTPGELSRPSLLQVALDKKAGNETIEGFGEKYDILVVTQAMQTAGFENPTTALNEGFGEPSGETAPFKGLMAEEEAEKEYESTHPVEHAGVRYATLQEGIDAAAQAGGGTVILHDNLQQAAGAVIPANMNITIDGNGHTVTYADGSTATVLITVSNGAKLTTADLILDGGAIWQGEIDATLQRSLTNTGRTATGALIATAGNGSAVLNAGTVLQNNDGVGAVSLATRGGGSLTLNGAHILNNTAEGGAAIWGGDDVTINEGSRINGNYATSIGGAIRMVNGKNAITFSMTGGEMNHNKSAGNGGAIWGGNNATYNLSGGEMAYNSASAGGAIWSGNYEKYNISGSFALHHNNAAELGGAIRFGDHASLNMTGGSVYSNTQGSSSNAFYLNNNSATITGGTISDDFTYSGGLGLTVGTADIDGVIHYSLTTNHNTAYLAKDFSAFSFKVNETAANFASFNFKPAAGYTYAAGDEDKLVCLNDGYATYWDAATGTFRLQAD